MKNPAALFSTVPAHDHLGFYADQALKSKAVAQFLDLEKADVARIANVATASVRFDEKIPKDVLDRLVEIANVCALVAEFFEGDAHKTALWFKTPNPQFGGVSPRDMIRYGRYKKLLQFVLAAREDNREAASFASVKHAAPSAAAN